MSTRDTIRAALIATVWGANFVVIEQGLRGFPPFLLLTARFLLVAFPLVFFVPRPAPWRTILLIGGFMSLGQFSLLYLALHLGMPAGLASLLTQAQVMFTILISSAFLGERPSTQQAVGVVIGLAGLATIALGYGSGAPILPLLLTLGASLSWSVGNVLSRRAKISDAFGLVVWSALLVPIPALALAFLINGGHEISHALTHIDLRTIWSTLYTVLGASLFGYVGWNKLLARHPVSSVVPFMLLIPVVGIVAAWLAMGQIPTLTEVVGGVTQIAGVAIASIPGLGAIVRGRFQAPVAVASSRSPNRE